MTGRVTGPVGLSGGLFLMEGTASVGGLVTVSATGELGAAGQFRSGVLATGGGVRIAEGDTAAGSFDIAGGEFLNAGTLDGSLTNRGTGLSANLGTITGPVALQGGTLVNEGVIEAGLTITGGIFDNLDGDVEGPTTIGTGTINAVGGDFSGGILATGGSVNILAATQGDILNNGGQVTILSGRLLDGDLSNQSGQTTNAGTIGGTLDVTGGIFIQQGGGTVEGAATLSGGILDANGGAFRSGILASGGELNINGNTTAEVTGAGADIAIGAGARLLGDVRISGGTLTNDGIVIGATGATGGVVTNRHILDGPLTISGPSTVVNNEDGGLVVGQTLLNGGILNGNGGVFEGGVIAQAGLFAVNGTVRAPNVTNTGAVVSVAAGGTLQASVLNRSGTMLIAGTVAGPVVVSGGDVVSGGTIQGRLDIDGGTMTTIGGVIDGRTTLADGLLIAGGGSFLGGILAEGGQLDIVGDTLADVDNLGAAMNIAGGATLDGDVTNAAALALLGDMTGSLDNSGTVLAAGGIGGDVVNTGFLAVTGDSAIGGQLSNAADGIFTTDGGDMTVGSFENAGRMNVAEGDTLSVLGTGVNLSGGVFDVGGRALVAPTPAVTPAGTGTLGGNFVNSGGATVRIFEGGSLATSGTFLNEEGAVLVTSGVLTGDVVNDGRILATDAAFDGGLFVNNAGLTGEGSLTFGDGLRNEGRIDLGWNDTVGDTITVAGLSGDTGLFHLDLDLSENQTGGRDQSDRIVLDTGTALTGQVTLSFNTANFGGRQAEDILVIEVDSAAANDFTVSPFPEGLGDPGGRIVYRIIQDEPNGSVFVQDLVNPGIGALAGSSILTQSLIGAIVNRPSSPLVTGSTSADPDKPCGPGVWARYTGGSIDASGRTTQSDGPASFSTLSAAYNGLQLGSDIACFDGYFNGWDVAFGAMGGVNIGTSRQPVVFVGTDIVTSRTTTDFEQRYAGLYVAAARDRLSLDLQVRAEQTDFNATNVGVGGSSGLGLTDAGYSSMASTISGQLSYVIPMPEANLIFVPTAGFAYTLTRTDPIVFDEGDFLRIDDFSNEVVFIGGTLARSVISNDGLGLITTFGTATIYNDFASNPTSTFSYLSDSDDDTFSTSSLRTDNVGAYGELSVGASYTRLLDPGTIANAREFNASVRADYRMGENVDSWGVTAQMRLQF
ncbi:MAG: hypothetical protein JJT81_14125 [Rubellimicrobium sp.]|nr:hypothetical protein [Rubellimicrobium sp.]